MLTINTYTIGFMDDEPNNVRRLRRYAEDDGFKAIEIELNPNLESVIQSIIESQVDAVLVDYRLSATRADIQYDGTQVVKGIRNVLDSFPCFVLTGYEEEAETSFIDVNMVYEKEKHFNDRNVLHRKIKAQIENHRKLLTSAQEEVMALAELEEMDCKQEEKYMDLNVLLERSLNNSFALPKLAYEGTNSKRLDTLIGLAEELLKEVRGEK